jgi:hypothetical protein
MGNTADFTIRQQPACLGEHTDAILTELGFSASEIAELKSQKIVRHTDQMLDVDFDAAGSTKSQEG